MSTLNTFRKEQLTPKKIQPCQMVDHFPSRYLKNIHIILIFMKDFLRFHFKTFKILLLILEVFQFRNVIFGCQSSEEKSEISTLFDITLI